MKLRVGLLGLGPAWEIRHRPALRALGDRFEVRAVCDQIALRAEQAAREWNAQAVDGFRALANRPDIDALLMLAPQWYGYLPMFAACESGKAIYSASSFELDRQQAREVKERVERSGVAFMTEFPRRHAPATLRLKELIATRLGKPRLLFCHSRIAAESTITQRLSACEPGLSDLIELVDWCRYVVGAEPTSVFGMRHRAASGSLANAQESSGSGTGSSETSGSGTGDKLADEAKQAGAECQNDDYQMMNLDFSDPVMGPGSGTTAQISCGRYMPTAWQEAMNFRPPAALQVACEHGIAFVDLPSSLIWFDRAGRHQESLDSERPVGEQLLSSFYRSVTSLVHSSTGLEDAYRALCVVLEARRSQAEQRRIALEF